MKLDAVNYKNGSKNNWRRCAWNAVRQRVANPADALVLYLPGSTDLDRPLALARGFRPANLVAVERDPKVAAHLRNKGVTVILDNLNAVVRSWPFNRKIDVVIADFQCGISNDVAMFLETFSWHPAMASSVVVVNVMRGRDPLHAEIKADAAAFYSAISTYVVDYSYELVARNSRFSISNSRMQALLYLSAKKCQSWLEECEIEAERALRISRRYAQVSSKEQGLDHEKTALRSLKTALSTLDFAKARWLEDRFFFPLPSYKSTPASPVFDSAMLHARSLFAPDDSPIWQALGNLESTPSRGKVSAALAIRTRRLRGELGGGGLS